MRRVNNGWLKKETDIVIASTTVVEPSLWLIQYRWVWLSLSQEAWRICELRPVVTTRPLFLALMNKAYFRVSKSSSRKMLTLLVSDPFTNHRVACCKWLILWFISTVSADCFWYSATCLPFSLVYFYLSTSFSFFPSFSPLYKSFLGYSYP